MTSLVLLKTLGGAFVGPVIHQEIYAVPALVASGEWPLAKRAKIVDPAVLLDSLNLVVSDGQVRPPGG